MKHFLMSAFQVVFTLFLYSVGSLVIGLALWPCVMLAMLASNTLATFPVAIKVLGICSVSAACYFLFGLCLVLVVGALNQILRLRLRPGTYAIGHMESIKWFFVNAMFLCVRTLFLDFMLLTPLSVVFFRLMGSKLGRGVQINSRQMADLSLLTIGDGSVIGGNATVIGHLFEPRGLILMPVSIGKHVVVGLNAVIMPGVVIGDRSVVAAGAIVPKNTIIPPNTIYFSSDRQITKN